MQCHACLNEAQNRVFTAREMMVGFRDPFEYQECSVCGSLQILEVPSNLAKYYADGYYSFRSRTVGGWKRLLKRKRAEHALGHPQWLGALICRFAGPPQFTDWVLAAGVGPSDAILDVGCGAGHLLRELGIAGFSNLTGIDPFLDRDQNVSGVVLEKRSLKEMDRQFDFVMLHHSFEHMPEPADALRQVHRILKPGRSVLLRCPVAACYAWRTYGPDWVQLDAPRHLFIPSRNGFAQLAARCGFELLKTTCDSTEFQFSGSELYRRDVPLRTSQRQKAFSRAETKEFSRRAAELNLKLDGDSACFYLKKS